jgi:hypothetical protein
MTGKSVSFGLHDVANVADLKGRVQQLDGTPVHLQHLIFNGLELKDGIYLDSLYNGEKFYLRWKRRLESM